MLPPREFRGRTFRDRSGKTDFIHGRGRAGFLESFVHFSPSLCSLTRLYAFKFRGTWDHAASVSRIPNSRTAAGVRQSGFQDHECLYGSRFESRRLEKSNRLRFEKEMRIAAPPKVVFAFHESPGALERLSPP